MNWLTLKAALPQAVLDAVVTTPNGLTTLAQVYVERVRRSSTDPVEAYIRLADDGPEELGAIMGGTLRAWDVQIRIGGLSPTETQLQSWGEQVAGFFGGRRLPGVTDLMTNTVTDWTLDEHPKEGVAKEVVISVRFVGVDRPFLVDAVP